MTSQVTGKTLYYLMPTDNSRKLFNIRTQMTQDIMRRSYYVKMIDQLLALELCPYTPGQIINYFNSTHRKSNSYYVSAIVAHSRVPYYKIFARVCVKGEPSASRDTRLTLSQITGATNFGITDEFISRITPWYEDGRLRQMPMTHSQITQAVIGLTSYAQDMMGVSITTDIIKLGQLLYPAIASHFLRNLHKEVFTPPTAQYVPPPPVQTTRSPIRVTIPLKRR